MVKCQDCGMSGGNMVRCKKCNGFWCKQCVREGKGRYPKTSILNKCPYCGVLNSSEPFR